MQFSPRLRDIKDQKLSKVKGKDFDRPATRYPSLKFTGVVNPAYIASRWDDLLRIAGSMKLGYVTASLFIGKLQSYPRRNNLTYVLQEYGRLIKTVFILRYLASKSLRRKINTQLNKGDRRPGEALHALRNFLWFGGDGKIRKKQQEEQQEQALCLNIATNYVVLWNTVYMQQILDEMQRQGYQVYTVSELLTYFEKQLKRKNNYRYLVNKYLRFCLEEKYLIDEISFAVHTAGKPGSMVSPVRKFLRFAQAHGIRSVRADPVQSKVPPAAHELILQFIAENTTLRGSESKAKYVQALNAFFLFMQQESAGFTATFTEQFVQDLRAKDYSPFTINLYVSAVKQFARWLLLRYDHLPMQLSEPQRNAIRNILLIGGLKTDKTFYKDSLSKEERDKLFAVIAAQKWQAIASLMVYCGLRTVEVTRLKAKDIDLERNRLWVLGKGKASRQAIKLFQACALYLHPYLATQTLTPERLLFQGLTTRQIRYHMDKYLMLAGLKRAGVSAHSLRHTAAQLLLAEGVNPVHVQRQLRHQQFETTQFYVRKQIEKDYFEQMPD